MTNIFKTARLVGLTAVIAGTPAVFAAVALAQSDRPASPAASGQAKPASPGADGAIDFPKGGSAGTTAPAAKTATAPTLKDVTVGTAVFGSDGQKVGEVKGIKSEPGGAVEEIHVKTGGVLGFGSKVVVIPANKIAKGGQAIQVAMTSEEIGKLPAIKADNKG